MIRQAISEDRWSVAELHYMAGTNIFDYFFASQGETVRKLIERLYHTPDTFCSQQFAWVDEERGNTRGVLILFPGGQKEQLEKNVSRYGRDLLRIAGWSAVLKMVIRNRLNRFIPVLNEDELYIQAVAVYPKYRGQRVASSLLQHAFNQARALGFQNVSLLVEIPNTHAFNVYQKYGFNVMETCPFPRRYHRYGLNGVHKMVATVFDA